MVSIPQRKAEGRAVRLRVTLFAGALFPLTLSGCQSIELNANNAAQLRVIDASPDTGGIDAYQNSTALAYNLGFGTMTTYVPMLPGGYALSAVKAGTRQTLATANVQLAAGRQYTEIVGNVAGALQQTLYVDQTQPAPAGEIAVRLIDQITRAGAVDVYLVAGSGKAIYTAPLGTGPELRQRQRLSAPARRDVCDRGGPGGRRAHGVIDAAQRSAGELRGRRGPHRGPDRLPHHSHADGAHRGGGDRRGGCG